MQEGLSGTFSRNRILVEWVKGAANAYRESATIEALRGVPVEELNCYGGHFRVKVFRDTRFLTVAVVHTPSVYALLSARGAGKTKLEKRGCHALLRRLPS